MANKTDMYHTKAFKEQSKILTECLVEKAYTKNEAQQHISKANTIEREKPHETKQDSKNAYLQLNSSRYKTSNQLLLEYIENTQRF